MSLFGAASDAQHVLGCVADRSPVEGYGAAGQRGTGRWSGDRGFGTTGSSATSGWLQPIRMVAAVEYRESDFTPPGLGESY